MQISYSRVGCFKQCPYQYKLRYIDKLQTYFNNDPANPLVIGTALHTGIEKDSETALKEYFSKYPIIDDKNIDEAIKLEEVIRKCREVLPDGDHEVKVLSSDYIGFIDLLAPVGDNEYDLYDFKYSNNVESYLQSAQLHVYKYYFEKLNPGKTIRKLYFVFAPKVAIRMKKKNKSNPRDETIDEFRKRLRQELDKKEVQVKEVPYDIEKVKDFLRDAKDCRMATQFPKNPTRLCDWCDYQKYCESEGKDDLEIMTLPKNERRTVEKNGKKKIWLYGAPFSGKTYFANQFPDPLMLNTDGNVKYVDSPYLPIKDEVKTEGRMTKRKYAWETFTEAVDELEKQDNDFKTIIVDLLEDVNDHCRVKVCLDRGWEHESDDSFKAYDIVRSEFLRTLKRLLNLDYNIVLISHEDTSRDITRKTGDKITAIKPNINEKLANKIAGMVDIVARVINDNGHRVLSFKTNEVIFGGGRLTLKVDEIPCDYAELCRVYDEANTGKPDRSTEKKETPAEETPDESKPEAPRKRKSRAADPEEAVTPDPKDEDAPSEDKPEETPTEEEAPRRRRRRTEEQ